MRPLVLKISAFGPYAGETVIPMEKLGEKGLYLITGDTGAGKTTIFDAICYALFGEASGNSKETSMLRSKYANPDTPTKVELTFLHKDKEYKIVRNPDYMRPLKNKEGYTKQAADACIYFPDGKTISKIREVNAAVESLLGINRDQFAQIAMIAQGEFKKLLLADTKERQKIFRDIFKTEYYERLQRELDTTKKVIEDNAKDGKKSINQYVEGILVDEDNVLAMEVEKARNGKMTTQDVIELLDKLIKEDENISETNYDLLEKLKNELEIINMNIGAAKKVEEAKKNIKEAQDKLKEEQNNCNKAQNKFNVAKKNLEKKEEYNNQVFELENEIKKHKEVEEKNDEIKQIEKDIKKIKDDLGNNKNKKREFDDELSKLKEELEKIKDAGINIEKYNHEKEKNDDKKKKLKEVEKYYDSYCEYKDKLKKAQDEYKKNEATYNEIDTFYRKVDKDFRAGQAGILARDLKDGQCCPVCGSTTHPNKAHFSDELPSEKDVDDAKKKSDNAHEKVNKSSEKAKLIKEKLKDNEDLLKKSASELFEITSIDNIENEIENKKKDLEKNEQDITSKLKNEYNNVKRKEKIEDELIKKIEDKIKSLGEEIDTLNKSLTEKETRLGEKQDQINNYIIDLKFDNKEAALNKQHELKNVIKKLQDDFECSSKELDIIKEKITKYTAHIKANQKTISNVNAIDLSEENEKKRKIDSEQRELSEVYRKVVSRKKTNESIRENILKKSDDLTKIEKKLQWISSLANTANGALGGKEKIMLETYIQATYFERIINRANLRLMKMSDAQYELKRQERASNDRIKSGLELSVIDHYNGTERSVKTLSGGESFMASLSLALGLSDEVQSSVGGIKIDTMFVDEGFGSLDSDSLDQAYKTLSGITQGNRLVGIISHVSELKNKIDKQVIVTKEKSGGSMVSIQV